MRTTLTRLAAGVAGAGYQLRNPMSTRCRGRRATRGMALLAGLLAALAASGAPAYATNTYSPDSSHNLSTAPHQLGIGVGTNADGRMEVFAIGSNGQMYTDYQTVVNGGWSGSASLGGTLP
jgi:hypothetical protein